ncbi:MAG TPA: ATPase domain-containing protein [Aggregatilineales bacterium]|nr:flagellar accessory protein FlaH [Anaerolineae bacterium]HUN05331.1 ATPase domain-containing protein [Aggregatilineales bacterium]
MKNATNEDWSKISSHNVELDSRMGGGLPSGSLTLIEGGSGSGKSVLSQQLIWGALSDGYRVHLFTSESTVRSLIRQMETIDLDILDYVLLGKCRIFPVALSKSGISALPTLLDACNNLDSDLIVIDSITGALTHAADSSVTMQFFQACQRITGRGTTLIVTLHDEGMPNEVMNSIRSMCDANLKLRTEKDGQRIIKLLEVAKIRGASSGTGSIVGFDVEPGWGMRVIPISKARG